MSTRSICIFGGAGFVGSAIAKAAVSRGWNVTSISRLGLPYTSSTGHSPAWVHKVNWTKGDAFDPDTYHHILPTSTAIVSTLGILLESDYKTKGTVAPLGVLKGIAESLLGSKGNPLKPINKVSYERMNRDAALSIFRAFAASKPAAEAAGRATFVLLSAEDIFRPFVPSRYIEMKREAERTILEELSHAGPGTRQIRPVFARPSLVYHPIIAPLTTLPATLIELSSGIQSRLPAALRLETIFPTPTTPGLAPATTSLASLLTIPAIHVDTIAEAVCKAIEQENVEGVMGVREMRKLVGYDEKFDNAEERI